MCFVEDYIPTVMDTIVQRMVIEDPTNGMEREITLEIKDFGRAYWKEHMHTAKEAMKEEMLH